MDLDIEAAIASANDLLASIYESLGNLPSSSSSSSAREARLTVSPEAQRDIERIERFIQEVPSAPAEQERPENQTEEPTGVTSSTVPAAMPEGSADDSVIIISPLIPQPVRHRPSSRRRTVQLAGLEDVIDLCNETETVPARPRRSRPSEPMEVINLVSPASNGNERIATPIIPLRSRATPNIPLRSRALFNARDNRENDESAPTPNPDYVCAICLDSYISKQPVAAKCGHVYCKNCIIQALRPASKCPKCRRKICGKSLLSLHF